MRRFIVASAMLLAALIFIVIIRPARAENNAIKVTNPDSSTQRDDGEWFGLNENNFTIQLGSFGPTYTSEIRVDPVSGEGSDINLEDTSGLTDSQDLFRADATWRVGRKQRIGFSYFSSDRSVLWTLQEDEQVGDTFFPAGTGVNLDFDTSYYMLKYLYSFKQSEEWELAASLGVHTFHFNFSMRSTAGDLSESADATAPLPMIGLYADYRPSPRWRLYGTAEALDLRIGDYSGHFSDLGAGVEYTIAKNFGVGIGYDRFDTSVDASASNFNGHLEYIYRGFQFFAVGRF